MKGFFRVVARSLALAGGLALAACTVYQPVQPAPGESWAEARARAKARETSTLFRSHRVARGETLAQVARAYGVSESEIAAANRRDARTPLRPGEVLAIPERSSPAPSATAAGEVRVAALPPPEGERGAGTGGGPWSWLESLGLGGGRASAPAASSPPTGGETGTEPPVAATATPARTANRGSDPEALERAQKTPPPLSGRGFLWPVAGRIVSGFGDKPDGRRNDGINIAARKGTPVKAAENGVVVYAGDAIPGFGNLVLVRHAEGWTTAYAHLDAILVRVGDRVQRGQPLGRVGETGDVKSAQLHFELRRGREPVDPRPHLVDPGVEVAARPLPRAPGG
ncbi:MAG: M23 family metallopeptidase [Geminicoccaceae bacterium]|nr:M23 family metallopeptidase [Geminicoccaceae bacterium]MCS7268400.1 M23 family metallopeptidase [Geminicoccaceae bacterium]MDW8124293.1 M23 family metallopeptidase [Geminicoccaceae bacterium]MDW8342194.1 M23 family metallopeptidase [Geminicoccaceae bacterium]